MIKKSLAVCVILLFIGVAFTSSINANVSKPSVEPIADVDTKEEDCGCEEETPLGWNYPFICTILYPIFWFGTILLILGLPANWVYTLLGLPANWVYTLGDIASELNCWWGREPDKLLGDIFPQSELVI